MKESTLCSSITESSARHTRPPVGRPPHGQGFRDSQPNSLQTASPTTTYRRKTEAQQQTRPVAKGPYHVSDRAKSQTWVQGSSDPNSRVFFIAPLTTS